MERIARTIETRKMKIVQIVSEITCNKVNKKTLINDCMAAGYLGFG